MVFHMIENILFNTVYKAFDLLKLEPTDLILICINLILFFTVQSLFFRFVASKSAFDSLNSTIESFRRMIFIMTYKRVDITNFIKLTEEEEKNAKETNKKNNDNNDKLMNYLIVLIVVLSASTAVLLLILPSTFNKEKYYDTESNLNVRLFKTFFSKANILLIVIILSVFVTEFYIYGRYIKRMHYVDVMKFVNDPVTYFYNTHSHDGLTLQQIYADQDVQLIKDIVEKGDDVMLKFIKPIVNIMNNSVDKTDETLSDTIKTNLINPNTLTEV